MISKLTRLAAASAVVLFSACGGGGDSGPAPAPGPAPNPPPAPAPAPTPPPAAPTASFTSAPTAEAFAPVAFDASASTSGDGSALLYHWDFGQGRRGSGRTIAQAFDAGGAQAVTLTVIDGAGRTSSTTRTIQVTAPVPVATVQVEGRVRSTDGAALADVTATAPDGAQALSDTEGRLRLNLGTGVARVVRLSKSGYADQIVTVQLPANTGTDGWFEARMRTRDAAVTLADAAAGGRVDGREGASLVLPAGALVDGSGAAVSGPVQISMTPVDVTLPGGGGFPGSFDGVNADASVVPLVSYGTTEFVLSRNGQPVQLAPGRTATIELPLHAGRNIDASAVTVGATIPLWSLDERTGLWVNEGSGTVVASSASPTGLAMRATVAHFTWWNIDIGFEPYGPQPRCVEDTSIGIPGGGNNFATATICNMLAEFEREPATTTPSLLPSSAVRRTQAPAPMRLPGFSRRMPVPITGGITFPVPANANIVLSASALNGTWMGQRVVSGPVGLRQEVTIPMRPIAGSGSETIALPFDDNRALLAGQTARFSFAGTASRWAIATVTRGNGSNLAGTARLLRGTTVLASANFEFAAATLSVALPADDTYTIEVTPTANAPGAYRLQVQMAGGIQDESIALPLDANRTLPAYTGWRGALDVQAPSAVHVALMQRLGGELIVRARDATGAIVGSISRLPNLQYPTAAFALPSAGRYTIEVATRDGTAADFRLTAETTSWLDAAPVIEAPVGSLIADVLADRANQVVLVHERPLIVNAQSVRTASLQRLNGAAWTAVAPDLPNIERPCAGAVPSVAVAFDAGNAPVVANVEYENAGSATLVRVRRWDGTAWAAVGPNAGVLPVRESFGRGCDTSPVLRIDAAGAPVVAYRADGETVVARFDGSAWNGYVTPSGDRFAGINGTHDLAPDPNGRLHFTMSAGSLGRVTQLWALRTAAPAAWEPVGPNNGTVPMSGVLFDLFQARLRFDAAGLPVLGAYASVTTSPGIFTTGLAVFRYSGSAWSTTGGYRLSSDSYVNASYAQSSHAAFVMSGSDALLAWANTNASAVTSTLVQRNTPAGWSAIGAGNGEVPQFYPHGLTLSYGQNFRLEAIGGTVYLALVERPAGGAGFDNSRMRLLRRTP